MITVVLLKPETPENIGFIARAMANFDFNNLIIINPKCNHLDDSAIKTSKHAANILKRAEIYEDLDQINFNTVIGTTSVLGSDYNIPRTPLLPEQFARKITGSTALVLGPEGTGLSNEDIKKCDYLITIPSSRNYPALNISHAAAIILYEIYKAIGKNQIVTHIKPASVKEKSIMMQKLDNILHHLEFSTEDKQNTQKKVWKNVFEKSMMSKREAYAVIGFLKKLEDKLSKF